MSYSFSANNPLTRDSASSSYPTGSFPATFNTLSANSIPCFILWLTTACTITSCTGNSLTWTVTQLTGGTGGGFQAWLVYAQNVTATGSTIYVAVNFTGGPSASGYVCIQGELLGGPTSGLTVTSIGNSGTSNTPTGTLTSLGAGSAIIASTLNGSNDAPTGGSGYTLVGSSNNGTYGYAGEYNLSSTSGSVAATFGDSSSIAWGMAAAAFSPASVAAAPTNGGLFFGANLKPSDLLMAAPLAIIRRRMKLAKS